MKWVTYISNSYVCKNKLQEEIHQFLRTQDRTILQDIAAFKLDIEISIKSINDRYPRCKSIEFSWYQPGLKTVDDYSLQLNGICNFSIHQILNSHVLEDPTL